MIHDRPVSGVERVWLVAERLLPPFAIQWVIEGEGHLDEAQVVDAVERVAASMPVVRARTRGMLHGTRWACDGPLPVVRRVDASGWDATSSQGAPFLESPLAGAVELLLLDGRLVVRLRHALMDGLGSLQLLDALFAALRGEPVEEDHPLLDQELLLGHPTAPEQPPPRNALPPMAPAAAAPSPGRGWARRTYAGSASNLVPRVLQALAAHTRQIHGDGVVRVDVPVDLRRHRPGLRSSSNLTGMLRIEVGPGDDLQQVRGRIEAALASGQELGVVRAAQGLRILPLWLLTLAGRGEVAKGRRQGRFGATATVSTLGRVALDRFDAPGWKTRRLFVIPPANPDLPLLVTMVGTPAGVELCATAPAWLGGRDAAVGVLEGVVGRLG